MISINPIKKPPLNYHNELLRKMIQVGWKKIGKHLWLDPLTGETCNEHKATLLGACRDNLIPQQVEQPRKPLSEERKETLRERLKNARLKRKINNGKI